MMGRGAEGGKIALVRTTDHSSDTLARTSDRSDPKFVSSQQQGRGMDIYSQAVKALAVKSPFGGDEAGNAGGGGGGFSGPLVKLPSSADPKRKNRARKTQAVSKKREFGDLEDGNPRMFWVQMEDYFREVVADDVKLLFPRTNFGVVDSTLAQDSCFNVRPRGRRYLDLWAEEDRKLGLEETKSARGIKRKLLTASPVSKRKKAALATPDTITTVISPSAELDEEDMCHVCSSGESDPWNQIIFCESCSVAVHQECYGIQSIPEGQWLCSLCSYRQSSGPEAGETLGSGSGFSCVLCPCNKGALKPVAAESDSSSSRQARFAHLFCTQWVPETFLQDTVAMEPVRNVEGVREERWRLVCVVCKEKHGACIQCSHGLCATSFHPLCARDAKLWMEVSSREDTDEVDLRAFCPRHSALRNAKPVEAVAVKEGCSDDKFVNAVVAGNTGRAGQSEAVLMKDSASVSPNNAASPSDQQPLLQDQSPGTDVTQEQLVSNVKKVMQTLAMPIETVAVELDVPRSTLSLWLEGKSHEDESKMNTSVCAWLCTYSSLLKCSGEQQSDCKLKKNGYSDGNNDKETSPSQGNSPESTATFSTGPVKINCQLLQVEEDFGSFGDEADDRPDNLQREESQKPMTVMQNQTRLFDNEVSNGFFDSDSPGLDAPSPRELDDSIDAGGTDKQLYVIPGVMRRLLHMEPNASKSEAMDCSFSGQEELECSTSDRNSVDEQWQQLRKAKNLGVLDWCPQDEVEAEIFVLQNQLIDCARSNRVSSERLLSRVVCQLFKERQAARKQMQDLLVVSQFLADVKEARKQGRKEKKDREAQAVLAAATAAAAASPRTGYVKREAAAAAAAAGHDDHHHHHASTAEYKLNHGNPHSPYVRPFRPPVPKPPRLNVSSSFRVQPAYKHEDQFACDVCSSNESLRLNRIVHCQRCNVAVHQDCYGVHPYPTVPWHCQPCTELQLQPVKVVEDADRTPPCVQCALCPNAYGAFKKSSDGRWVHVFCALWVPKTTFGREQSCPIGGLDAVPSERFNLTCTICQQQQGACIKCNFGHCSGAFHPMCARDSGLYISARNINGRAHYRAFCERHSPQQRAKSADFVSQADLKQHGSPDEINSLRQIRVEFERVRLICERICKRERIKRELTHCIKDLYINQLAAVVAGYPVDQSVHHHHHHNQKPGEANANGPLYSDSLLDVPWTAESRLTDPLWRNSNSNNSSGKEMTWSSTTRADAAGTGVKDQKKLRKYNRHSEPLGREKIMTPTEASMHNKLLPKGFAYVPVDVLNERGAVKQQEHQGGGGGDHKNQSQDTRVEEKKKSELS